MAEDEMVRQCHHLNGHEFERTPGDSEGSAYCSPWGCKEPDTTQRLKNNNKIFPRWMDVTTAATEVRTGETVAVRRICYQEFASEALVA